ncbi:MAG TPA: PQQ-binding-like beta-propeller repeat protein [Streptosporangiaceae bacterium]
MRVIPRGRVRRFLALSASLLAASLVVLGTGAASTAGTPAGAASRPMPGDWPTWQHDPLGSRFNGFEHRITPGDVGGLKLKWAFTYPQKAGTPRSQPAVTAGGIYFGGPDGKLYARDARTGAARWSFDLASVGGGADAPQVQDGPAVARGKVYFGDTRGYLYAVDQRTGELAWATRLDTEVSAIVTSSPIVYGGRVYVGVSSGQNVLGKTFPCCTFRGHVDAVNADTGKVAWRHYTVPKPRRTGTWPNGVAKYAPSGGGVWSTPSVDPRTRTLYVGTGQNYTGSGGHFDSVLALDTATGRARWTRKMTDVDTWRAECNPQSEEDKKYCPNLPDGTALDFDLGAAPNLFRAGGRPLVGIGQKAGVYHVLDARTGKIVWQRQLSKPMPSGGLSGIQWGSSYDGRRLYIATYMADPGTLFAIDPATGHVIWKAPAPADGCTTGGAAAYPKVCQRGYTPAVTSTPGVVWEGGMDGKMRAYSARTGKVLWAYDTMRDVTGVNGQVGRGGALAGGGGAVVAHGMVYVQSGYAFTPYPNDKGAVLMAFGR